MFELLKQFYDDDAGAAYFGRKVVVPQLPGLKDILRTGTEANMANLPGVMEFAGKINTFNQSEVSKMLEQVLPGIGGGLKSAAANAAALARGEIPSDVQTAVVNSAAARSLRGGYGGTGMSRNLVSRDLGLTSLAATEAGQTRLQALGGFARAAFPVFDFSTAFFNPAQMLDYTYSKFQRDLLEAKVAAAPDPVARGRADQEMALMGMILSVYSGGPGYKGSQDYSGVAGGAAQGAQFGQTIGNNPGVGGGGYQGSSYGGFSNYGAASNYGATGNYGSMDSTTANNAASGVAAGLGAFF